MMELGFNMAGTEEKFEEMLICSYGETRRPDAFSYIEKGVARADTLISVSKWCKKMGWEYSCSGIELVGCEYFDPKYFIDCCPLPFSITSGRQPVPIGQTLGIGTNVALFEPGQEPIHGAGSYSGMFHFCLIDGCHGKACVESDFKSIEPWIKEGGIVAFHDAMEEDQGVDYQPHCHEPINVREAIKDLGLFNSSRPGWECFDEVHGDKSKQGNGFAFFRRTPSYPS